MIVLTSLLAAIIPMVSYLAFIWWLDRYEREPLKLILLNFFWGAIGAVAFGIIGSLITTDLLVSLFHITNKEFLSSVIVAPLMEEPAKGICLVLMLFSKEFDNITDGAVYGGTIGLGFGMSENFLYFISYGQDLESWIGLVVIRSLFSAVMHCMATAIFGASLGYVKFKPNGNKILIPVFGLFLAMTMHGIWNGLVSFETTSYIGLVFIVLSVVIILVLFQVSLLLESRLIKRELAEEVALGMLDEKYLEIIPSSSKRDKQGWINEDHRRNFIKLCTELAFRKSQYKGLRSPKKKEEYGNDIVRIRTDIQRILID